MLTPSSAYLLVYHGSRDPRPHASATQLAQWVAERMAGAAVGATERSPSPEMGMRVGQVAARWPEGTSDPAGSPLVEVAALELAPQPLHQQIQEFGRRAQARGCHQIHVIPLFLQSGMHVNEDIPMEVAQARQMANGAFMIHLHPFLGGHPRLSNCVKRLLQDGSVISSRSPQSLSAQSSPSSQSTILLAHGSRRIGGNAPTEAIASRVGAIPAYWSLSPGLSERACDLIRSGCRRVMIVPYFLFSGAITDAIAQLVEELADLYPDIEFQQTPPLGATPDLADLIVSAIADWCEATVVFD